MIEIERIRTDTTDLIFLSLKIHYTINELEPADNRNGRDVIYLSRRNCQRNDWDS